MLYEITVTHRVVAGSEKEAIQRLVEYETDSISRRVLEWEDKVETVGSTVKLVRANCESVSDARLDR